jgi:hypothetical protein
MLRYQEKQVMEVVIVSMYRKVAIKIYLHCMVVGGWTHVRNAYSPS